MKKTENGVQSTPELFSLPTVPYYTDNRGGSKRLDFGLDLERLYKVEKWKYEKVLMCHLVLCRLQDHINNTDMPYESTCGVTLDKGEAYFSKSYFTRDFRGVYNAVTGYVDDTTSTVEKKTQRALQSLIDAKLIESIDKRKLHNNNHKVTIYRLAMDRRHHSQTINNSIFFARTAKTMRDLMDYCQININAVTDAEGELVPERVGDAICDIIEEQRDTITQQREQIEQLTADNAALAALMNGETDGAH